MLYLSPQSLTALQLKQISKAEIVARLFLVFYRTFFGVELSFFSQSTRVVFWTNWAFPLNLRSFRPIYGNKNQKAKWKLWKWNLNCLSVFGHFIISFLNYIEMNVVLDFERCFYFFFSKRILMLYLNWKLNMTVLDHL